MDTSHHQVHQLPSMSRPSSGYGQARGVRRRSNSQAPESETRPVMVAMRCRPLSDNERQRGDTDIFTFEEDGCSFSVNAPGKAPERYTFDTVMGGNVDQEALFDTLSITDMIEMALMGYTVTIFAYGSTGSGKTYTINGRDEGLELSGVVPRAIDYIFSRIAQSSESVYYTVRASTYEIYNEQVIDLLNPGSGSLPVRWSDRSGFRVENTFIVDCDTPAVLKEVIEEGQRVRHVGSHELNRDSSRSHQLIDIQLIRHELDPEDSHEIIVTGMLRFVDLAGSERLKESLSEGTMLRETKDINKSLFMLCHVISQLASGSQKTSGHSHIPYRDSLLTKLLMEVVICSMLYSIQHPMQHPTHTLQGLGGNAVTLMIATCSPSSRQSDETMRTLQYATRALNIKNKPVVNADPQELLVQRLREEIKSLKAEIAMMKRRLGPSMIAQRTLLRPSRSASSGINRQPSSPALPPHSPTLHPPQSPVLSPQRPFSATPYSSPIGQDTQRALSRGRDRPTTGVYRNERLSSHPLLSPVQPRFGESRRSTTPDLWRQPTLPPITDSKVDDDTLLDRLKGENDSLRKDVAAANRQTEKIRGLQRSTQKENDSLRERLSNLERLFMGRETTKEKSKKPSIRLLSMLEANPDMNIESDSDEGEGFDANQAVLEEISAVKRENEELQKSVNKLQILLAKKGKQ